MSFASLFLLKCSGYLKYGPCPPARDWGSHVSGLVAVIVAVFVILLVCVVVVVATIVIVDFVHLLFVNFLVFVGSPF